MITITTTQERDITSFYVQWPKPSERKAVTTQVCLEDDAVIATLVDELVTCWYRIPVDDREPEGMGWELTLELVRDEVIKAPDLSEYFGDLAHALFCELTIADPDGELPSEITIAWPASNHEGVYRSTSYTPTYGSDRDCGSESDRGDEDDAEEQPFRTQLDSDTKLLIEN